MVLVYNTETVRNMDDAIREKIIAAGVPIEIYEKGYVNLGPKNRSAIGRFANICTDIIKHELPIPPSPMIEFIVGRTTGKSKQDFTAIVDAKKGAGKSYSSIYLAAL